MAEASRSTTSGLRPSLTLGIDSMIAMASVCTTSDAELSFDGLTRAFHNPGERFFPCCMRDRAGAESSSIASGPRRE
jgi:hypothetical protein